MTDGWKIYPRFIPNGEQIVSKTFMTRVEVRNALRRSPEFNSGERRRGKHKTETFKAQTHQSPFNVVQSARKGFFQEHNIPSHSALCFAVHSQRVQAKDVVKAVIAQKRLSPEMTEDKNYLRRVDNKMRRQCISN